MNKRQKYLTCSRKYDLPLFCASWLTIESTAPPRESNAGPSTEEHPNKDEAFAGAERDAGLVVIGGGGGDRKNGLMNSLLVAQYDSVSDFLSEAITTFSTDDDPPYRLAVHPGSSDIVFSVAKDCRLVTLKSDGPKSKFKANENTLQPLQGIGEQNCLVFSSDGTMFASGGEDGHLRVFQWPSLKLVLDQPKAHQSVKDLDFSLDSSLLASTGDSGPCRIWDIAKASAVASLSSDKGETFGYCRFSRDGTRPVLYVTLRAAGNGLIGLWDTATWKKISTKKIADAPISAFSISPDGKLIAIGSSEGDLSIVDSKKLVTTQRLKSAHMVFVTSMEFAPNSRALLSVSGDSSARVTAVKQSNREGYRAYVLMFIILLISVWLYWAYGEPNGENSRGGFLDDVKARLSRIDSATRRTFEQIDLD